MILYILETCPSLMSTNITIVECSFKNEEVSCIRPPDGTIARYKCANYYEDPQFSKNPIQLCRDGQWDQKSPECVPGIFDIFFLQKYNLAFSLWIKICCHNPVNHWR